MTSVELATLMQQAERLTPDERAQLAEHLLATNDRLGQQADPRRRWSELRGVLPHPALGEDAQDWVSRTRREADAARETP